MLMRGNRYVVMGFEIKTKGLGKAIKTDLGFVLAEIPVAFITAVGESVGPDPSHSEVHLMNREMADGGLLSDSMFAGVEDPA